VEAAGSAVGAAVSAPLADNELLGADLPPGQARRVTVLGEPVAVYNVDGRFYATHDRCTHMGGPLSEGDLNGTNIVCPWHASCFDVTSGAVTCGPAKDPVRSYAVTQSGDRLRFDPAA
jgi:nitrite reductase/ring-hydroxylating ferredoxin subunit